MKNSKHLPKAVSELNSNDQRVDTFKITFLNALQLMNHDISNVGLLHTFPPGKIY